MKPAETRDISEDQGVKGQADPRLLRLPSPRVVVGMGELGTLFAEAFLRLGHPVIPVLRKSEGVEQELTALAPELVLVATAEDDLAQALDRIPTEIRSRVVLVQNELRMRDLERYGWPTMCVAWFERKNGMPPKVIVPTVVSGPLAEELQEALARVNVETRSVDRPALAHELALKNLYILGLNFAGLRVPGPAGELLRGASGLFSQLFDELLMLEAAQSPTPLDAGRLWQELTSAIARDEAHKLRGRLATRRLERTLALARQEGLRVPLLEQLGKETLGVNA